MAGAMAPPLTRFDLPCTDPTCTHTFMNHFGSGLGYVNAGPCKVSRCLCQKFRKPEKAEMQRILGRPTRPSTGIRRGLPAG